MMRITCTLFLLVFTRPVTAQELSVAATEPVAGDSSVALHTTVQFTFSAPLDTTARFSGDLPVEFFAIAPPDSIRIDSTYFSDDLTALRFDVTHTDSTDFVWILTGAVSQDGMLLCQPHVLSYTTADRQGPFSVGGRIYVAIPVAKGQEECPYFGIFAALWSPLPEEGGHVVAAAMGTMQDFETIFTVQNVREGVYWPAAHLSVDGFIFPQFGSFNFYDADHDGRPDRLVVADSSRTGLVLMLAGPGATERTAEVPGVAALLPNYPNPFNPQTTLAFRLERPARLALSVYDLLGRKVATVAEGFYLTGLHEVVWRAAELPSGLYVTRLAGDGFVVRRMVMLVK